MSDPGDQFRSKDPPAWFIWAVLGGIPLLALIFAVVKFIAWWKIAFVL